MKLKNCIFLSERERERLQRLLDLLIEKYGDDRKCRKWNWLN